MTLYSVPYATDICNEIFSWICSDLSSKKLSRIRYSPQRVLLLLLFDRFLFLPDIVETMRRDDGISRSCDAEGRRTKFVKFREAPRELNGMGVLLGRGHLICKCIVQARQLATTAVHPVTGAGGGQQDQYFNLHLKLLKGWQPPPCSPALLFQTDLLWNKCLGRNRCSMKRRFY